MGTEKLIKAWLAPLAFEEVDAPLAHMNRELPTLESVIAFLCAPTMPRDIGSLIARYREISTEPVRLNVAPADDTILTKLVWPLRHAKASYVLGNYYGAIALCGMVAEMVALLLYEISSTLLNAKPLDVHAQRALFGREFEKLGQERRVSILRAFNIIDDDLRKHFETIRLTRNRYLHLYSQDDTHIERDAVTLFHAAATIVAQAIGQDMSADGRFLLYPRLLQYLERKNSSGGDGPSNAGPEEMPDDVSG